MDREAFDMRVQDCGIVCQIILKWPFRLKILDEVYLHGMALLVTVKRVFYVV